MDVEKIVKLTVDSCQEWIDSNVDKSDVYIELNFQQVLIHRLRQYVRMYTNDYKFVNEIFKGKYLAYILKNRQIIGIKLNYPYRKEENDIFNLEFGKYLYNSKNTIENITKFKINKITEKINNFNF